MSSQTNRMMKTACKKKTTKKTRASYTCTVEQNRAIERAPVFGQSEVSFCRGQTGHSFGTGLTRRWTLKAWKISATSIFRSFQRQWVTQVTQNSCKHHRLPQPPAPCMPWNHTHLINKPRHLNFAKQHKVEMSCELYDTSSCLFGKRFCQKKKESECCICKTSLQI